MDVLLIHSNREKSPLPVVPLGLAYVAESAAKAGHQVEIMDLCFSRSDFKGLYERLREKSFDLIGISIRNLDNVDYYRTKCYLMEIKKMIEFIKDLTTTQIVLGGSGFSVMPAACLRYLGCDLGIKGPGEESFTRLLNSLEHHKEDRITPNQEVMHNRIDTTITNGNGICGLADEDISQIPGLVTLNGVHGNTDERSCSLSPFGSSSVFRWINMDRYFRHGSPIPIQTKRGCHFQCIYCSYPEIEGRIYRLREPREVAQEILTLVRATGYRHFEIVDSTFNSLTDYAMEICESILRLGLKISLQASGITPALVNPELINLMKRAGFNSLVCSPDSGSDLVLDALRKGFTVSQIDRAGGLFHKAGLQTLWCFILAGPGETQDTLTETLEFAQRCLGPGDAIGLTVGIRIYPGTEICRLAMDEGFIEGDEDLLLPKFYISPNIDKERLHQMLKRHVRVHPHCILVKDAQLPWLPYLRRASTLLGQAFPLWKFAAPINKMRTFLGLRN